MNQRTESIAHVAEAEERRIRRVTAAERGPGLGPGLDRHLATGRKADITGSN